MAEQNGTPKFPRADTPALSAELYAAATEGTTAADEFLDALASRVAIKVGNGNGNGGPPGKQFMGLTGGGWTKLVVGIALAAAMTAGTWVLLVRDTLKDHGAKIDAHTNAPMHPEADRKIEGLNVRVEIVEDAVVTMTKQTALVVEGVEELKQEKVNKLKDEVRELKAENRRLERQRR